MLLEFYFVWRNMNSNHDFYCYVMSQTIPMHTLTFNEKFGDTFMLGAIA